jgi:Outer membrane protein beta-barrel domain
MRFIFTGWMICLVTLTFGQNVESFGVFGGFNIPFTIDQGLNKDPRFVTKVNLRATPIGFYYGYDKVGYGFAFTPNYLRIGQTYKVRNTTGGDVGFRQVDMDYVTLPFALKIHINDIAFFRLSLIAALSPSFLIKGQETQTWGASKLTYPAGVSVPTDPGYSVTYDGVFVPKIDKQVYVTKDKFSPFQLFGAMGIRTDFDLNDDWSINFDGRASFGIFDSHTAAYQNTLKNPSGPIDINNKPGAPDLYGSRRDVYLSVEFGVCRIITTKEKFKQRHSDKSITTPRDIPKPRNKPPKRR